MYCCSECFYDTEIKAIIDSSKEIGDCDFCNTRNVKVYNLDCNHEIAEYFDVLLERYSLTQSDTGRLFAEEVTKTWNIVSQLNNGALLRLLGEICKGQLAWNPKFLETKMYIPEQMSHDYVEENSIFKGKTWEDFKHEIVYQNRFHLNTINLDIVEKFFLYSVKTYTKGEFFYRARISDSTSGFLVEEMGAPPSGKTNNGRINPKGIMCLYLSNSLDTTINEVRAGLYDYISVGTFELSRDIRVVDFSRLNSISPFSEDLDITVHAINKQHLEKLNDEIKKPLRRFDSELTYLTTQYFSEFAKSLGYDGIKYMSSMDNNGFNIALFDESVCTCKESNLYEIKDIQYLQQKICSPQKKLQGNSNPTLP